MKLSQEVTEWFLLHFPFFFDQVNVFPENSKNLRILQTSKHLLKWTNNSFGFCAISMHVIINKKYNNPAISSGTQVSAIHVCYCSHSYFISAAKTKIISFFRGLPATAGLTGQMDTRDMPPCQEWNCPTVARLWLFWNFYRKIPWQKPSDAARTRIIATAEFSSRSNLLGAAVAAAAAHLLRSNNFHSTICLILPHSFSPPASNLRKIKKTVLSLPVKIDQGMLQTPILKIILPRISTIFLFL